MHRDQTANLTHFGRLDLHPRNLMCCPVGVRRLAVVMQRSKLMTRRRVVSHVYIFSISIKSKHEKSFKSCLFFSLPLGYFLKCHLICIQSEMKLPGNMFFLSMMMGLSTSLHVADWTFHFNYSEQKHMNLLGKNPKKSILTLTNSTE